MEGDDDMTAAFAHVMPWTEEEFLALGETPDRVELFDGSLLVSPAPTPIHQLISTNLTFALRAAAREAGLRVYPAVNLRLRRDRIPIPDLVLTRPIDVWNLVVDASSVVLVCEIISPSNAATDRVLKMHHYAEAGIQWYLLTDPDTRVLDLYRLEGKQYKQYATGKPGTPLRMDAPVVVEMDPDELLSDD
jgi:Uma2 family endonuclease